MAAWGTMMAVISTGGRISARTPGGMDPPDPHHSASDRRVYFRAKVVCGYLMALMSMAVLYLAGTALGVRLSPGEWLTMTALILVGLVPFVVLGILVGHLVTPDSVGPAIGGITSLLALLGGAWGPLATSGVLLDIAKLLPSYWLVQAGKTAIGGHGWPAEAWIVVAVWTAVLARLTVRAYRRDTARP